MKRRIILNSKELAALTATTLNSKKAKDVMVIDIGEKSSFADYFVMASGVNERQIDALAGEAEDVLAKQEVMVKNIEGKKESGWILMDYGDIIINILTVDMRDRYNIEKVWADCDVEAYDD